MINKKKPVFGVIKGQKVEEKDLAKFAKVMNNEVIPEIVKIVERRQMLAVKTREEQLKC